MKFFPRHYIVIKDLLVAMVHSEIKTRNREKEIGMLWEILDPVLLMLVYLFIIKIAFKHNDVNYPVYLYTALICWRFTEKTILGACVCFQSNRSIIQQVYFPRILIPMSVVLRCIYEFLFSCVGLIVLLLVFRSATTLSLLLFPVIFFIQVIFNLGMALLFSVLGALFSDIHKIMKVILRLGWHLSPGIYSIQNVPENYLKYYLLNPMAHFFDLYRGTTIHHIPITFGSVFYVITFTVILLVFAVPIFVSQQRLAVSSV